MRLKRVQDGSEGGGGESSVCVNACVCVDDEGLEERPQHSVVRRPNKCQYVNENRPLTSSTSVRILFSFFFFFSLLTNLFYTAIVFLCCVFFSPV